MYGATLAGAGGGGFMLLISKERHASERIGEVLAEESCVLYDVAIDSVGLRTVIVDD